MSAAAGVVSYGGKTASSALRAALQGAGALPAFNFYTFAQLEGILAAARELRRPLLVQVSRRAWDAFDPAVLEWIVRRRIPAGSEGFAFAHLDHGWGLDAALAALQMGFPSVMIDASRCDIQENIAISTEVAAAARSMDALVEAEVGVVGRPGVASTRTSTDDAVALARAVEPDFLAVSIGTAHGESPEELDFGLAEQIHARTSCRLALHGGSGVSTADLRRAREAGFFKFNFATGVDRAERETYERLVRSGGLPHSSEIESAVARSVEAYCKRKFVELGLC
jgi:fructose/tagatose bisphosphate aldolase